VQVSNTMKKQSIFDDPLQLKDQATSLSQAPYLVIKELQTDLMPRKEALQAMDEIDILAQLTDCPHIVKYCDSFVAGTKVNIVMEYCEQGDLQRFMRDYKIDQKHIPEKTILSFFI